MKSENDILAEYVRQNPPNIANSLEFAAYRFCVKFREAVSGLATSISEILAAENEGKEPEQHE